uniref:Symplekin n=1 Tax=Cajanus cajan TaxID=3821 RepID=A0A151SP17_CAJCA|nr:Symplekin [Cajanus cajan]
MAAATRDQALSLLAAANNHGDLAIKTSSLKQAKDLLLSIDPSLAADLFPYLLELQSSPESLVRKLLIQIIEEIGFKAVEHSPTLISVILTFLQDSDVIVVKQSIVSGTNIFCSVFEELIVKFQQYGKVERWLEDIWMWMLKFKDAVFGIALEPGSVGIKLLALKFLETFVLLFTSDISDTEKLSSKGVRKAVNVSWLVGGHPHPVLDPVVLMSDANRTIGILLNLLQAVGSLPGCLTITVVNCVCFDSLAAIARKRPQHYDTILSALLDFSPNFQTTKGCHAASIQYSLRTAFLGFLRCTYSPILESRERLMRSLRAINAGDAADQVIRQVDKMIKNGDRSTRDARVSRDDQPSTQSPVSEELSRKRPVPLDNELLANGHETISKRIRSGPDFHPTVAAQINDSGQDLNSVNGVSPNVPVLDTTAMATTSLPSDTSNISNQPADSKRDPRRDPRRLDPRRVVVTPGGATVPIVDDTGATKLDFDEPLSSIKPISHPAVTADDNTPSDLTLPPYVELSKEQESKVKNMAVRHIIDSYKNLHGTDCQQFCMPLLARLVAQIDDDDEFIKLLQKHILEDHWRKKICFCSLMAKTLLDSFPASDKSFSRLLGEVPLLPESSLKILNDLCYSDVIGHDGKIIRDIERVTQGLGAIWSLILGRPQNRQACLGIALKCAIHPQDEIRAKAIRLVTNKLFQLSYVSGDVEKFATEMLLSAVHHEVSDTGLLQSAPTEQRAEAEVESHETSCTSQVSESTISENDSARVAKPLNQSGPSMSFSEAQRLISLFFALCTKKPSLLQIVFNVYGQAPKIVKQAFHRHIPIVVRALGHSYTELLRIISDPPQGSENLLTLVLQILTQDTTPSSDLISTIKRLYETKFRDVTILVPLLSSLSKQEVLPIFPRLVDLPLEKFQRALAHILQGSAHTGPALTPVEVLVAIHGIVPEKDGLALKKAFIIFLNVLDQIVKCFITDACSACFEQRTVFTQQVLAKALNQMVDQTPLPLLFMRTVIQAIDAFPALVDFVMEILSKLVTKQVWRMPKLWVGFLKCVYQTQPRSFHVLLQLPPQQLESALNRHANLRGPLASYASQPTVKSSLSRSTLAVLGLANETHVQQHLSTSLHPSDTSSSVHGATLT